MTEHVASRTGPEIQSEPRIFYVNVAVRGHVRTEGYVECTMLLMK